MASVLILAADDPTRPLYFLTAFAAGIVSFLSPCVLPIVPAYLSLITGLTVGDLQERDTKVLPRIALDTGLFVAGFTAVFVGLGLVTTAVGDALFENQTTLTRISGVLIIVMACYLAGSQVLMTPRLYQERRFHPRLDRFGAAATPVAGAAFGFAWTPCIGPVLGAVLSFAAQGQSLGRAAFLLVAYSLGLGCSFLAVGLAFGRLTTPLEWCKRHSRAITLVSAAVLLVFGLVLVTDNFTVLTARLSAWLDAVGLGRLLELG